jgi:RND family efflux transporter MFP subunit
VTANRNRELAKQNLVSRMQLDDSEALERSTAAQVSAARASVTSARINLGYATVTAPISGRASQLRVLEGALVGQGEATLLTTIEQVDPIYVYFDQPASEFERLQRAQASGAVTLAEGNLPKCASCAPTARCMTRRARSISPTTASIRPQVPWRFAARSRIPIGVAAGMYVNVRLTVGTLNKGFRVPQLAVQRDGQGAFVLVVGGDGKVAQKRVETVAVVDNDWVISSGIADGDQVIVSGLQKVQPGAPAKAAVVPGPVHSRAIRRQKSRRSPNSRPARRPLVSTQGSEGQDHHAAILHDRPVFAWVIAIIISLGGVLAIRLLPAEAYPDVAPPQVSISATYPGANADTVERTVIQVIEQQLTGIDNLVYFSSSSRMAAAV